MEITVPKEEKSIGNYALTNVYVFKSRILPAIISVGIPIFIFNHFFVSEEFSKFVGGVLGAKLFSNLTIEIICLFFLSEICRFFGKNLFERVYFKDELKFPATTFLLFKDNTYSEAYKSKIRTKIMSDFKIRLSTKKEETNNDVLARTKIAETMTLIRKKLHRNKFLLQHNIEYGAIRNMIGGSILGASFSFFNIIFFSKYSKLLMAEYISVITFCIYVIMIIFSKPILVFYGKSYAKILYREYMG